MTLLRVSFWCTILHLKVSLKTLAVIAVIDYFPAVSQHHLPLGTEFLKPRARQQLKIISSDGFQTHLPEEHNFKGYLRSSEYGKMEVGRGGSTG